MQRRLGKVLLLLAGIVFGQAVLYGPSLLGRKILLPVDNLGQPGVYLPRTPEVAKIEPQNPFLTDLICYGEPARRFAAAEFHAGRLPMWTPWNYAGAPFVWPKFSPFLALRCCTKSPVVLAWVQLLTAIVAGLGTYLFCRRVLAVSFWPAAIASWCYPLTGFFVLWQGYGTCLPVVWLPWALLAVDKTVRGTSSLAPIALSVATSLVLVSGQLDMAAQALLGSALYGLWCLADAYCGQWLQRQVTRAVLRLSVGWGLGLLLAAPYILPVLEYTHTGARIARRSAGQEERPPVGLAALPQVVLPDMYGTNQGGSPRFAGEVQTESSAAAYAGLWATLLVAPLAWCSRRHRSVNAFWMFLCVFSLSWCLDLPGFVSLLRLPGLNMMSHNRLVFLASFAILAMTAVGLEVVREGAIQPRWWFWLPAALLAGLGLWCVCSATLLPDPIATPFSQAIVNGKQIDWTQDPEGLRRAQLWHVRYFGTAAVFCGVGVLGWLLLWSRRVWQARFFPLVGALLILDLLWFGNGRSAQCDPALYYPPVPVLDELAHSTPGRIVGGNCLPASLASMRGLRDIRGYDAVDPARLVELVAPTVDPRSGMPPYALMQWMTPRIDRGIGGGIRLHPILDMLGVRYLILRGSPRADVHPFLKGLDYWVMVNSNALPRAFVPRRVEAAAEDKARLEKLAAQTFDPREVAYVESPVNLPGPCQGMAVITQEIPTRVTLTVRMETPGLVVLSDLWDKGWQATLDGKRVLILRVNHAVRGVLVPAGSATLEFRYAPASFAWGLRLAALAAIALLCWLALILRKGSSSGGLAENPPKSVEHE